jgi:hypothetical protein
MTMNDKPRSPVVPALVAVALIGFLAWSLVRHQRRADALLAGEGARAESGDGRVAVAEAARRARENALAAEARRAGRAAFRERLAAHLDNKNMREGEVSFAFKDADALRRFLERAGAAGLRVLSSSGTLLAARVRYSSLDALAAEVVDNADDYDEVGGNVIATIPETPALDERAARAQVPVRNNLLDAIGAAGLDNSLWGRGVTIAVLDSGVMGDATFGQGRLRALDVGYGLFADSGAGHGTAVAALAAGASDDAPGVAPGADILSIRVTDADGVSDMYTIAQAIIMAADAGAQIINVSLGGSGGSTVLMRAIDYAMGLGAVVVASAGNDQASRLAWPAAYAPVISVGATDAVQQQVIFSNSGEQLQIAAPGYFVQTAWVDGERINFTGTSASAPVVAGAIAALMSVNPGMTAQEAWVVLSTHADDAGAMGRDNDYGAGGIDLGWAMESGDPTRVDTAVSSHYYNAREGTIEVVVQNRGATGMSGMTLVVDVNGAVSNVALPWVDPGASAVVKVPVQAGAQTVLRTTLLNADGVTDRNPANNQRASVVAPATGG